MSETPGPLSKDPVGAERRPSRRAVLAGIGGSMVLAACGSGTSTGSGGTTSSAAGPALNLVGQFDANQYAVTGIPQRLVVSLLDSSGQPPAKPATSIDVTVLKDGKAIAPAITVPARSDGVPAPYYPVPFTFTAPGTYALSTTVGGAASPVAFKVNEPGALPLIQPGQQLPVTDTPTETDGRGVDPICTRSAGTCPLHGVNLRDALATGRPIALLISTPAFCQIGVCGPVLEMLLAQRSAYPTVQFLHAEVYRQPEATPGDPSGGGLAPIVEAFGLNYEPALFLAGADGVVKTRLDNVFDKTEITAGLDGVRGA